MKALVTDDEKHVREAIKLLVNWKEFGIDPVLEAADVSAAIKIIEQERPEIIFTDMRMPGKSGSDLLEWIHVHAPHSKTIVISGYDDFTYVRHTVQYGGVDYLLKPIDPLELGEAVKKAVESWKEEEAQLALKQRNLLQQQLRMHVYEEKNLHAFNPINFKEYEFNIGAALCSGNEKAIEIAVQIWIDAVKKLENITVEHLEFWEYEYNVFKMHWIKEAFEEGQRDDDWIPTYSAFSIPIDQQGLFCIDLWKKEIVEDLKGLSKIFLAHTHKKKSVIYEIIKFIKENYDKDITLQDVSNHFYLSKEHISRKFKQEIGENISEYIGKIRMERACMLLLNPTIKIKEVAEMVGYEDEKYFSKVFKKIKGLSPNEFRRKHT